MLEKIDAFDLLIIHKILRSSTMLNIVCSCLISHT